MEGSHEGQRKWALEEALPMTENMTCAACGAELPVQRGVSVPKGIVCPSCGVRLAVIEIEGDTFDKLEAYAKAKGVTPDQAIAEAIESYAKGKRKRRGLRAVLSGTELGLHFWILLALSGACAGASIIIERFVGSEHAGGLSWVMEIYALALGSTAVYCAFDDIRTRTKRVRR